MNSALDPIAGVDLAVEPDFRLGGLLVSPSTSRVRSAAGERRLEPKVMEVLVVLSRHAGRTLTRDQLIDVCWGGRIVSDDAVNRVLAQVRALSRSEQPAPFTLETVPKVGFRLIPGAAGDDSGAIPAASAGFGGPTAPILPANWRRLAIAAFAVLLILAIGGGLAWRFAKPEPVRGPGQNGRIDVMMFTPQGADPTLPGVAKDLSESIVRVLAGAGEQVAERPLARDAAGDDAELRVAGTVEREDENYVVNAQILDRRSGAVLWSDRLVRSPHQQMSVPGRVASIISATLHCALEDRKSARTPISTEAFGLYVNTCSGVFIHPGGGMPRMLAAARRLVKAAPEFAAAHAMHAIAAANAADELPHATAEAAALHAEAKAAAETALRLDPRTAKAYSGLALNEGVLSDRTDQNWYLVEQYTLKALKIDPDLPPARNEYSTMLRATGRLNEALEMLRAADQKDPRAGWDPRVVMLAAATGNLAGAEEQLTELEATQRTSLNSVRWTIAFWWDDPKTALAKIDTLVAGDTSDDNRNCLRTFLKELEARKARQARGLPPSCGGMDPNWRVRMLAREGDVDGAFGELKTPVSGENVTLYYPEMRAVRADPRFWTLARSLRLVEYWQKSGHWPDFCAEPGLPYDCKKAAAAASAARPAST